MLEKFRANVLKRRQNSLHVYRHLKSTVQKIQAVNNFKLKDIKNSTARAQHACRGWEEGLP